MDQSTPARHRPLVVGASAGGVEALRRLVGTLPADLDAAVFVVLHMPAGVRSALVDLLDRSGPLPVHTARDLGSIQHGTITVAVVLSGTLDDGAVGAVHVRRAGGRVFVQDPEEALHAGMPSSVLDAVAVDGALPVEQLAPALVTALERPLGPAPSRTATLDPVEAVVGDPDRPWETTGSGVVTCPSCGGPMLEQPADEVGMTGTYRCRVGHAYTLDRLVDEQQTEMERGLWAAIRVLEERAELDWRLLERATARSNDRAAAAHRQRAQESLVEARRLQALITAGGDVPAEA